MCLDRDSPRVAGQSKTTLPVSLIPLLSAKGIRVTTTNRSHDDFDIDIPGNDSHGLHRSALNRSLNIPKDTALIAVAVYSAVDSRGLRLPDFKQPENIGQSILECLARA